MINNERISIAVAGAAHTGAYGTEALEAAQNLGREVARHGAVLVTHAGPGFPLWAALGAKEENGTVIGFSPAASRDEHQNIYKLPLDHMDLVVFTGFGIAGRDILQTRSVDALIFGCGGLDTVHEFAQAFQEDKVMGVLEGSWDTDERLKDLAQLPTIEGEKRNIIFDERPKHLIEQIIKQLKNKAQ